MENKALVLVTGGTGFLGMQIILYLLQKNYRVRVTIRHEKSIETIKEVLQSNGISSFENLFFVKTELTEDDNWEAAMEACTYVLSVASPVFFHTPKDAGEAIRPAVEGIRRVLKFAREAGVKRVVMTSNFGAVGFSQTDKSRETTEADWTNTNMKGLSLYEKSKTLAEKAAWDFIKTQGGELEFATINPVAILGPALSAHVSGSFMLLQNLLNGSMKAVPKINLNIVDVRDVADLHIRAMITPEANGQRFIATAGGQISWPEIAALIRKTIPQYAHQVTGSTLPDFVLKLLSNFHEKAQEAALLLKMNRNVSNAKAREVLGWKPIATQEETIITSLHALVNYHLINKN